MCSLIPRVGVEVSDNILPPVSASRLQPSICFSRHLSRFQPIYDGTSCRVINPSCFFVTIVEIVEIGLGPLSTLWSIHDTNWCYF